MQVPAVGALLVYLEYFQSGIVQYKVAHVDGIAVAETGGIEQSSVVVDGA